RGEWGRGAVGGGGDARLGRGGGARARGAPPRRNDAARPALARRSWQSPRPRTGGRGLPAAWRAERGRDAGGAADGGAGRGGRGSAGSRDRRRLDSASAREWTARERWADARPAPWCRGGGAPGR